MRRMKPIQTDVVVLGAGPGGYAAALHAAGAGKRVVLVDRSSRLGGVCLNEGCIPSKAFIHATQVLEEARRSQARGITFGEPQVSLEKLRSWKGSLLDKLAQGIRSLADGRKVEVLQGRGHFEDSRTLRVETKAGQRFIAFGKAILATGSRPSLPPAFDLGNQRVMTSTEALELPEVPPTLLVVGGGYIGMELGMVYAALGSEVTLVEALDTILAGADPDLVRPVLRRAKQLFKEVRLGVKVQRMATSGKQIKVSFEGHEAGEQTFDRVLVAIGREAQTEDLGLENTKVRSDSRGFVRVNEKLRTDDPQIYAIGDVTGGVMLAHRATRQAKTAVDALLGEEGVSDLPGEAGDAVIPAVVFTDPEVAWCGLTEEGAKTQGIEVKVVRAFWGGSGRALTLDRPEGVTKLILEPGTERVLGVGVTGTLASELISEGVLAVEAGLTAKDLALTVHPHPTLAETLQQAAESFYGGAHGPPRAKRDAPAGS